MSSWASPRGRPLLTTLAYLTTVASAGPLPVLPNGGSWGGLGPGLTAARVCACRGIS